MSGDRWQGSHLFVEGDIFTKLGEFFFFGGVGDLRVEDVVHVRARAILPSLDLATLDNTACKTRGGRVLYFRPCPQSNDLFKGSSI